mgnify:CR=1 FL=1
MRIFRCTIRIIKISTGVKVIFADGVTVDEFNIDASVVYKKDNCIYTSLDKGVKISKNGENKDIISLR